MTKELILQKKIINFPEGVATDGSEIVMDDKSIKRNVYAAMEEYAKQENKKLLEYIRATNFPAQDVWGINGITGWITDEELLKNFENQKETQ